METEHLEELYTIKLSNAETRSQCSGLNGNETKSLYSLSASAACLNAKKASFRGWLTALSGSFNTRFW